MKRSYSQLTLGVVIILIGLGFLLDNINVLNFGTFMGTWWPLLLVLIGVVALVNNPRRFVVPMVIVAVAVLLQLRELDVLAFSVASLIWPAILIAIGLQFLLTHGGPRPKSVDERENNISVLFSGVETKNKSNSYQGGKLSAMFGGISLDLREAELKGDAALDIFTLCGGVELRVPAAWRVHTSGTPLLGGWEDKTAKPADKNAPTLTITGTCIMGGIEVKN